MTPKQKKTFVLRLEKMLAKKGACEMCPAMPNFSLYKDLNIFTTELNTIGKVLPNVNLDDNTNKVCRFCNYLVDISYNTTGCPCLVLGKEEALKRAHLAIEKFKAE